MVTISSMNRLTAAKDGLKMLEQEHPVLFEKLLDVIYLTRALHFKYHYMGCLVMDEDPGPSSPDFVYGSVLRIYKKEIQKLKNDGSLHALRQLFSDCSSIGYSKLCLLALGHSPESLVEPSFMK